MYEVAKHEVDSSNQSGELQFTFMADGPDRYGNPAQLLAFDISYSTPEGKKVLEEYCADDGDISDAFCASAKQRFPPD
jgi:hypothetical protein